MPDKVLFSVEFDNEALRTGADELVKKLIQTKQAQAELNTGLAETQNSLDKSTKGIKDYTDAIAKLDEKSSSYEKDLQEINKRFLEQVEVNKQLQLKYNDQKKSLEDVTSQLAKFQAQVESTTKSYKGHLEVLGTKLNIAPDQFGVLTQGFNQGFADVFKDIDVSSLGDLGDKLQGAANDADKLQIILDEVNKKLLETDPASEQFKELGEILTAGTQFLDGYKQSLELTGDVSQNTAIKTQSFRSRILELRNELERMTETGKENTEEFRHTQEELVHLTHNVELQQKALHILASETKAFDFGLSIIRAAGAGYEVLIGGLELLGVESGKAEEAQKNLLAIMAFVNGARELSELLTKKNTIAVIGGDLATKAYIATQRILITTFGIEAAAASVASKALLFTGVGAAVVALGLLISKIIEYREEQEKLQFAEKAETEVLKAASSAFTEASVKVGQMTLDFDLAKKGLVSKKAVLEEYNKTLGDALGKTDDFNTAEQRTIDKGPAYIQAMLQRAVAHIALERAAQASVAAEEERRKREDEVLTGGDKFGNLIVQLQGLSDSKLKELRAQQAAERKAEQIKEFNDQKAVFLNIAEEANKLFGEISEKAGLNILTTTEKTKQQVKNVFQQMLRDLQKQLVDAGKTDFDSENLIRDRFADKLLIEFNKVDQLVKEGKLTKGQSLFLDLLLTDISAMNTEKAVDAFKKKMEEVNKKISDQIDALNFAEGQKRIQNITDQFARERAVIDAEEKKGIADLARERAEALKNLDDAKSLGLITPENAIVARARIIQVFKDFVIDLKNKTANERQELAFNVFQKSIEDLKQTIQSSTTVVTEENNKQIQAAAESYVKGKITYAKYQSEISAILRKEAADRRAIQKAELEAELALVKVQLNNPNNTPAQTQQLLKQLAAIQEALANLGRASSQAAATDQKAVTDESLANLNKYVAAVGSAISSIAGFWQQVNAAEQASLDRSIAIQEKRVANAKELADKGNTEYLELEQKRLDELTRKREEAARKQLVIDNALRLSQATLAAISAVAQAAKEGGVIAAIAAGVAIIGVIAAAYSFAQSLQPQPTQGFFKGKEFVDGKPGVDTIPARLTRGERVVTADKNAEYWKTLTAVHNGSIPATVLNQFVDNYPSLRVNYDKLDRAAETKFLGSGTEVREELEVTNRKLDGITKALGDMGVEINIDESGVAVSVHRHIKKLKLNSRA